MLLVARILLKMIGFQGNVKTKKKAGDKMNTGESLITIAAMMLLSLTVLSVNNNLLSTDTVLMETKFGVLAVSLATSVIEEANKKPFDEAGIDDAISDITSLTDPDNLGPSGGETYPDYDDFDDYNGYTKHISNLPSAEFDISCQVCYVNPAKPDSAANIKTWHKKITVNVTSPSSRDTFNLSSVYSYWYFR